jgi:hypothetical protein
MRVEMLLRVLEARQAELAKSLLASPLGRDAFEFGRSSGLYHGLEMAKNAIIDFYDEADKKNQ